jgi:hypothetical protein
MDVYTMKVPYSDTFYCKLRYIVEKKSIGIKLTVRYEQIFVKSTIMRRLIEGPSLA